MRIKCFRPTGNNLSGHFVVQVMLMLQSGQTHFGAAIKNIISPLKNRGEKKVFRRCCGFHSLLAECSRAQANVICLTNPCHVFSVVPSFKSEITVVFVHLCQFLSCFISSVHHKMKEGPHLKKSKKQKLKYKGIVFITTRFLMRWGRGT